MFNPTNPSLSINQYGHNPIQNQFQTHDFTANDDFRGFHSHGQQQGHRNEIDNGSRIMQNGFNGFHSSPSTTRTTPSPARNEPDFRDHQPECSTMVTNQDVLQQQYGVSQSKPKHPQYAIKSLRVSTYRNFPPGIIQRPEDLAQAGFFYSGKDDVVYCYFCGQGLRAWEPEDDVWVEHARWSPHCVHLLNCKGNEFVRMVKLAETNPEMSFPTSENSGNRANISHQVPTPMVNGHLASGSCHKKDDARTLEDSNSPLLNTAAAQSVITNGYDKDSVIKAINVYKLREGQSNFSAMDILKIIFEIEERTINYDELVSNAKLNEQQKVSEPELNHVTEQPIKHQPSSDIADVDREEAKTLLAENRQLKDQTTCKICLEETVSIVFLPCGHLCCCSQCAPALRKCPICRGFIKGTVKTFLP